MKLIKYSNQWEKLWDDFVWSSKNGTIFHTRKFLSYHPVEKWNDCSVLFINDKEEIVALFPSCNEEGKIISHQGSTSGGLIVCTKNTLSQSLKIVELLIENYKSKEIRFRKHEYVFDTNPSQEVEFATQYLGFKTDFIELSTCVDLQSEPNYSKNTLSKINRSSNKIEIRFNDDNYGAFYELLSANLSMKHGTKSTHSLDDLKNLKNLFPLNYFLVSAYYEGKLIASIWLLKANRNCLHTFYIALDYENKSLYPLYTLVDYIIKYGKNEGLKYLNFGISTEEKGAFINEGLFNFKESFGGFGVTRAMYLFSS